MSIKINLLTFGQIAELFGKSAWSMSGIRNTSELRESLEKEYPVLKNITYSIAINKNLIESETILNSDDIVALLPPFSGG